MTEAPVLAACTIASQRKENVMRRRRCRLVLVVLVSWASVLGTGCGRPGREPKYTGPKVTLAIRFAPGSYVQTEEMDMEMKLWDDEREHEVMMSQEVLTSGDVVIDERDDSGEQTVAYTLRRVRMDISVPGREISADSDARWQGGRDELRETLSALVGWRAELRGRDGKLKADPRAMEDLNERMSRSFMMRGGQAQALGKMMGPLLDELLTRHWGALLPGKPVGPGDTWQKQMTLKTVPMLGEMTLDCDCRLVDVEESDGKKIAVLRFTVRTSVGSRAIDVSAMGGPGASKAQLEELQLDLDGIARFDVALGLSTSMRLWERISGVMSATSPSGKIERVNLALSLTGRTRFEAASARKSDAEIGQ